MAIVQHIKVILLVSKRDWSKSDGYE
ncbi:hypothetical protein CCACVL1_30574, partial [Corchorus capsularis]